MYAVYRQKKLRSRAGGYRKNAPHERTRWKSGFDAEQASNTLGAHGKRQARHKDRLEAEPDATDEQVPEPPTQHAELPIHTRLLVRVFDCFDKINDLVKQEGALSSTPPMRRLDAGQEQKRIGVIADAIVPLRESLPLPCDATSLVDEVIVDVIVRVGVPGRPCEHGGQDVRLVRGFPGVDIELFDIAAHEGREYGLLKIQEELFSIAVDHAPAIERARPRDHGPLRVLLVFEAMGLDAGAVLPAPDLPSDFRIWCESHIVLRMLFQTVSSGNRIQQK